MDMRYGIDIRGLYNSFAKFHRWDAVCSNGIFKKTGEMYDAFAYRSKEFPKGPEDPAYWQSIVGQIQKIHPIEADLVPVTSCFGGMAIYNKTSIADCFYDSIKEDCEHISSHTCAIDKHKMRMYMNPNQMIRYSHYQ